jgi:glutathione S-transferase
MAAREALLPGPVDACGNRPKKGAAEINRLTLQDPAFATYAVAASIMIIKAQAMAWLTVWRMMRAKRGFRSPEDGRRSLLNPDPDPQQLEPNERVERIRRIQQNDLASIPYFLSVGFLFVLTAPSLLVAQWLLYGYVVTRLAHFAAYLTSQTHDVRAALWTPGSLILIYMAARTLLAALGT